MEKYPNYVPPLPVGFGWSEDEEDDFTDQPSSTYRQTTPSFSHFQLEPNTSLNNKNNLNKKFKLKINMYSFTIKHKNLLGNRIHRILNDNRGLLVLGINYISFDRAQLNKTKISLAR